MAEKARRRAAAAPQSDQLHRAGMQSRHISMAIGMAIASFLVRRALGVVRWSIPSRASTDLRERSFPRAQYWTQKDIFSPMSGFTSSNFVRDVLASLLPYATDERLPHAQSGRRT
jgi:hypothetical protein